MILDPDLVFTELTPTYTDRSIMVPLEVSKEYIHFPILFIPMKAYGKMIPLVLQIIRDGILV
jgi:hypothetical protein